MDPTTTFNQFLTAEDPQEAAAFAAHLLGWLANGGFEPDHAEWSARSGHELRAAVAYAAWLADGAPDLVMIAHLHLGSVYLLIEHDDVGFHPELVSYSRDGGRDWEHPLDPVATFRDAFMTGWDQYESQTPDWEWVDPLVVTS